jgi:acyl homoserine lactone synthase
MRAVAVTQRDYLRKLDLLDSIFRLRARIFQGRLGWNVCVSEGRERDEYDRLNPTYIVALADDGTLAGCCRLLPASGLTMVANTFPQLLSSGRLNAHPHMVESSRFCVDTGLAGERAGRLPHEATLTMFAGIIEWSMMNGYTEIVTVTDVRFERILLRAGWPLARLGDAHPVGNTIAIAGLLAVGKEQFDRLKPPAYRSEFQASRDMAA